MSGLQLRREVESAPVGRVSDAADFRRLHEVCDKLLPATIRLAIRNRETTDDDSVKTETRARPRWQTPGRCGSTSHLHRRSGGWCAGRLAGSGAGLKRVQWPPSPDGKRKARRRADPQVLNGSPRNHGAIVRTECGIRVHRSESGLLASCVQVRSESAICENAPGASKDRLREVQMLRPEDPHGGASALHDGIPERGFEGGCQICPIHFIQVPSFCRETFCGPPHRRLQPGERQVTSGPARERPGKPEAVCPSLPGNALHNRTAGLGKSQETRDLVVRLARSVIPRFAENRVAKGPLGSRKDAVPSGGEEGEIGECQTFGEPRGQCVRLQVVYGIKRKAGGRRDATSGHHTRQEARREARPSGDRDSVQIGQRRAGRVQRRLDRKIRPLGMRRAAISGTMPP